MLGWMKRYALVLGGGGARGAYEVGVLSYILGDLAASLGRPIGFDIIVGTSSGAINAAFLASGARDPAACVEALAERWRQLHVQQVYRLDFNRLWRAPLGLIGRRSARHDVGLLSSEPLRRMLEEEMDWASIRESVRCGALYAVAVTATEFATSRNVIFFEGVEEARQRWSYNMSQVRPVATELRPEHVLASAAIPLIFPPVEVAGRYYLDGGLGQQSPLRPPLRLGADRILAISLRKRVPAEEAERIVAERSGRPPTWAQVLGKTMNAVLLDRTEQDVARIERMNRLLRWGQQEYGEEFNLALSNRLGPESWVPYRDVPCLGVSPSEDLGCMAARHVRPEHLSARKNLHETS